MISCDNTALLMYQYHDSPQLRGLMMELTREFCSLQVACEQLQTRLSIELSEGVQLDLIGEIIGQPRPLNMQVGDDDTFVFADPDGIGPWAGKGLGWSGVGREDVGGRFVGLAGLLVGAMLDSDYKTLLRARIFSNISRGTVDDLISFLNFVIPVPGNTVVNDTVGEVTLIIGRPFSSVERDIILLMAPVAAGIRIAQVSVWPPVPTGWNYAMEVGFNSADGRAGFRLAITGATAFGSVNPEFFSGKQITSFNVLTNNSVLLYFNWPGEQLPGMSKIVLTAKGFVGSVDLPWQPANLRYAVGSAPFSDFLRANVGKVIGFTLVAQAAMFETPYPWEPFTTHAAINDWLEEMDLDVPPDWFSLTIAAKKAYLVQAFGEQEN